MRRILNLYKNTYSGLSPASWWLSLVMLVNRSGTMVVPFMTLYLTEALHYSIADAGKVMAIFGIGAIFGGILGGRLTDRLGFYNIQIGSLMCGGILFIALGQMHCFAAICLGAFFLSVLNDAFRPANATAIAHYSSDANRTRSYSLNRLAVNLGWSVGGALGGFIASRNYQMLFWIDGLTNIGAALLLITFLAPSRNALTPSHKTKKAPISGGSTPYADHWYLFFILLTVFFGCSFFQVFSTLPLFYRKNMHLSPFFIGNVMALNGILIVIFEMAIIYLLEPLGRNLQFIMTGALLTGASYVLFNLLPGTHILAIFCTIVLTAGEMLAMPFMNTFWISRTNSDNRGQYAGLFTVGWSTAMILAPFLGTQMAQHYGFTTLWWAVGTLSLITGIGFNRLRRNA